ncbi:hypothetical protein BVU_2871 [Phocaeicola vulgatus ATCC 8482]|uniref:Transmembrane protein n=1 Tax=Phocaeicola vulgatus (strain ATCC 8482 / DSM 1447 / JCM 5826 / CCUG 4940 / NBRC 14291 / NCTC 11154) TaxID=435590 RepID=A6L499_PHOV8|nr:hypothetical protein BVU_2871 [Phocaeicola vulgatus ATCC 8482]
MLNNNESINLYAFQANLLLYSVGLIVHPYILLHFLVINLKKKKAYYPTFHSFLTIANSVSKRFTFSSSNFIVLSFSLSAPCRVAIVSTSRFIRSMLVSGMIFRSCSTSESNIVPFPRNNHSEEISSKVDNIASIVDRLTSLVPPNCLLRVFCLMLHLIAKALSVSL